MFPEGKLEAQMASLENSSKYKEELIANTYTVFQRVRKMGNTP